MNGQPEASIFSQHSLPAHLMMAAALASSNDAANEIISKLPADLNPQVTLNANRPVFSPIVSPSILSISDDSQDTMSSLSMPSDPASINSEPGLINKKRGRRPLSETSQSMDRSSPGSLPSNTSSEQESKLNRMKQAAKEQLKVKDESQLARFGNKYVIKGSEEYFILKKKNNEAVKRCRKNNAINQKHIEKKIKDLDDENRKLEIEVHSLELCVNKLKHNILTNKNYFRLPEQIQRVLNSI